MSLVLSSCNNGEGGKDNASNIKVYGGDIIRYSLCIDENDSIGVSCPIITNKKVKNISLSGFVSDKNEDISVKVKGISLNEIDSYNGYYVHFARLDLSCQKYDKAVDLKISKLFFDIDGKTFEYNTPYFEVKNTFYYYENYNCLPNIRCIKISGGFTGLYSSLPNESRKADLTITSSEDVVLKSYSLTNYLTVGAFEIDKKAYNSNEINLGLKSGEEVTLEYALSANENVYEDCIIKTSMVTIYEYEGKDYLWLYTPGIYVWKDYSSFDNIKRYIDKL